MIASMNLPFFCAREKEDAMCTARVSPPYPASLVTRCLPPVLMVHFINNNK
jgi:hypothetical protein